MSSHSKALVIKVINPRSGVNTEGLSRVMLYSSLVLYLNPSSLICLFCDLR